MVKVKILNKGKFIQCASCLKSTEVTEIYGIKVGETSNITLKLC